VEKTARVFASFKNAGEADAREYAAMSAADRLRITLELRDRLYPDAAEQRLASLSSC
jgi:hypothetical protein